MAPESFECVIIGGGAAGLCAATYLARFRRSVLVIDAGKSRLGRIPLARNVPGFPGGVEGEVLHARLRAQAEQFGARLVDDDVASIVHAAGGFAVSAGSATYSATCVLLATGVAPNEPAIADLEAAVAAGLVRYCPICDGPETKGLSVVVLGRRSESLNEARFLRTFSDNVTFAAEDAGALLSEEERARAAADGISVLSSTVDHITIADERVRLRMEDGSEHPFNCLYPCLGCPPRSELAHGLGCAMSATGGILTDRHQRTSIAGVYAAGDVLEGLDQIASAWGQAAIAATAIHNDLRAAALKPGDV